MNFRDQGIALRGPLSQFFSGLYLKPLDDAFNQMDVTYLRYQDDILILCRTKRQWNRCRRRLMNILHERHLRLSRKKSLMGAIEMGFHFLGISYLPTQTEDHTNNIHERDCANEPVYYLSERGGKSHKRQPNRVDLYFLCPAAVFFYENVRQGSVLYYANLS